MKSDQLRAGVASVVALISIGVYANASFAMEMASPQTESSALSANIDDAEINAFLERLDYPGSVSASYWSDTARVHQTLIDQCVARQGITAPAFAVTDTVTLSVAPSWLRLWLLPASDYGISNALAAPGVIEEITRQDDSSQNEPEFVDAKLYDEAVYGGPDDRVDITTADGIVVSAPIGGCFGEATRTLYGVSDAADYERTYLGIPSIRVIQSTIESDRAVQQATKSWSRCMNDKGWKASSLDDLYEYMTGWVGSAKIGSKSLAAIAAQESELAQADMNCRISSSLNDTIRSRFVSIANDELVGKSAIMADYRKMVDNAVSVVKKLDSDR